MTLQQFLSKIENGSTHILLFNSLDGTVILKTIWHNTIPHMYYEYEIETIQVLDYEVRLGIHE